MISQLDTRINGMSAVCITFDFCDTQCDQFNMKYYVHDLIHRSVVHSPKFDVLQCDLTEEDWTRLIRYLSIIAIVNIVASNLDKNEIIDEFPNIKELL